MENIKEVFVDGDVINVRRGRFGGYRMVYPIKDNEGKIIWINFLVGGWGNFFKLLFILFIIAMAFIGFNEVTESCRQLAQNPCLYCNHPCLNIFGRENIPINLTNFTLGG